MQRKFDFSSRFRILKGGKISLVVSAMLGSVVIANAAPSGGTVTSGSANISQSGTVTTINQSTSKASINWTNFSIASDETVNFVQPNSSSITLNRVIGNEKSIIDGALNANGQVWILNSNGILFNSTAKVNTAGILATTAQLSDADFNAGNYNFKNATSNSVINLGTIEVSDAGSVVLASNEVQNEGTIKAVRGKVHLVGADSYSLNLNGNSLVNLKVDKGVLDAMVSNSGNIIADGGEIYLTTNAVNELLKGVVNNTGIIEANSLDGLTGKVELFAHGGTAEVSGSIEANEGFVETSGDTVKIDDNFKVKADKWLIDPKDFTIASSGGDITGTTLSSNLENASVEIQSINGATDGNGDIFVNDVVSWTSDNDLTLNAQNNININRTITATGDNAKLTLKYNQANLGGDYYINAAVNLKAGQNFSTDNNGVVTDFTVITELGSAGSTTGTDLQGINGNLSGDYVLGADIDASSTSSWNSGAGWDPLGELNDRFIGNFDGLGHTIDSLTIDRQESYVGLFGYIDYFQTRISNINISNSSVFGLSYVGSLVGRIDDANSLSNIVVSNTTVTGNPAESIYIGGVVGYDSFGDITNVSFDGEVTGAIEVGGIVGSAKSIDITNSSFNGTVSGIYSIGGIIGESDSSEVLSSKATGTITGTSDNIGGIAGYMIDGVIENSYFKGEVSSTGMNVGGLVGYFADDEGFPYIENSYSQATVSGDSYVGGLVGYSSFWIDIINSYSASTVSGNSDVSGISGSNDGTVTDSFYDKTLASGLADETDYGKTTTELQTASTFSTWDGDIWSQYTQNAADIEGYGVDATAGYPFLTDVTASSDQTGSDYTEILFAGGFGTSDDAYEITNWTQLQNINNSNILTQNYYFSLLNDLSSSTSDYANLASDTANSGAGWNPIGDSGNAFTGNLNGLGHKVDNLTINRANEDYIGLFGQLDGGSIQNLGVTRVNIVGKERVGGLVGTSSSSSTITNSYVTGSVSGVRQVGGLVGNNNSSTVENSYSAATVNGTGDFLGGLIGYNAGAISNSYATGDVSADEDSSIYVGGLVGYQNGSTITNSYATNKVTIPTSIGDTGGLVGRNSQGTITNSYYDEDMNSYFMLSDTGYGKSTAELRDLAAKNWDDAVWVFGDATIAGYGVYNRPYLKNLLEYPDMTQVVTGTLFNGGFGTSDDAYTITNWTQLQNINHANILTQNYYFSLLNDLTSSTSDYADLASSTANSGAGWKPLGDFTNNYTVYFDGEFDGLNHTISDLYIDRTAQSAVGLFGFVKNGSVSNLNLTDFDITGFREVGALAGAVTLGTVSNSSTTSGIVENIDSNFMGYGDVGGLVGGTYGATISDSYSNATVTAKGSSAGGLVGYAGDSAGQGTSIENSYSTGTVNSTNVDAGGLVGFLWKSTINDSYATGDVINTSEDAGGLVGGAGIYTILNSYATGNVTGTAYTGGLLGNHSWEGTIENSYAIGDVIGTDGVGGLVGETQDILTLSNSYATGDVTASDRVGGLVGSLSGTIDNSYYSGNITGNDYVGGLVGKNFADGSIVYSGIISNSYAIGSISGNDYIGGLVGYNYGNATYKGAVSNSYAANIVTFIDGATGTNIGGMAGVNDGTITNSYYDIDVAASMSDEADYGKTTKELQTKATYDSSWNITLDETKSKVYPYLVYDADSGTSSWYIGKYATALNYTLDEQTTTYNGEIQSLNSFWTNSVFGEAGSSLVYGDDYKFTFNEQDATGFKNADTYNNISIVLLNEDYELDIEGTNTLGTLTINKANATVTANSSTVTYDGTEQSVSGFTATGLVNGETTSVLDGVSANAAGTNAGTYASILSGTDENYNLTFNNGSLVINKANATVTANSFEKFVGEDDPTFTYTTNGLVGNDTLSGNLVRELGENIGKYLINKGTLDNSNYTITFENGLLTIQSNIDPTKIITVPVVVVNNPTPNQNEIVLTQPIVQPANQVVVNDQNGNQINIASTPIENENQEVATNLVTLSEIRNDNGNTNANPNGGDDDVRIPLNKDSVIKLVNGGVNLVDGVEQQYFVSSTNDENKN